MKTYVLLIVVGACLMALSAVFVCMARDNLVSFFLHLALLAINSFFTGFNVRSLLQACDDSRSIPDWVNEEP